ncbi:MAG TPA: ATP-binding protein, partial [Chitinophagaceae bacterium]|nr:ATP-binding protein [Chitinophagaceae bacterium]
MKSQSKIILIGVLAFFALTYFIWNTYQNSHDAEATRKWVDHSYLVMQKIDEIANSTSQLESNTRGYLITRNQDFLSAASDNGRHTTDLIQEIKELTVDNPAQYQTVKSLSALLNSKIDFHKNQQGSAFKSDDVADISPIIGKTLMDSINLQLSAIRKVETDLLKTRITQNKAFVRQGFITTLVGTISALLFIAIILWQLNTDIQRRKRAERDLQRSRFLLQSILDNIPLMIQVKDLRGNYLLVNRKFKETLSFTDEQVIGKSDYDLEPENAAEYERTDNLAVSTKQPVHIDEQVEINNQTKHFHHVKFPLIDQRGTVFAVGGFGTDVTEKELADQELKASEQKMRALLSSTKEGFFMIDRDYKVILINEEGKSIMKFSSGANAKIGDNINDILPTTRKSVLLDRYRRAFQGESMEYEQTMQAEGETARSYLISFRPVREGDEIIAVSVVARDITQLARYRQQLIEARKKAEKAEKHQEQFLANISHEIRTPLNGIVGMANLLQKTKLDTEQRDFLSIIKYSSDNLLVLINDILDFSKIKAGKLNIEKIEFNLFDVVQSAVSTLQQRAKEKDLGILIFFHDEVPKRIKGDPYRLNQILSNLLSNAIKFTQDGYIRIEISSKKLSERACAMKFRIKDTGIGIEADKLSLIFESFAQASEDVTRKFGGTGLGLTITRQLVEMQGGNISLTSQHGAGTTVSFEIPYEVVSPLVEENKLAEEDNPENATFPGKKVLVVEDNEINRKVIAYNLEPAGIETTMAIDGKQAVMLLEKGETYDLIIMDLQMPVMNGFQATVYIREKLKLSTPIVAMTASALKNEEQKCKELGMNEYLTKPFAPEELFRVLQSYLLGSNGQSNGNGQVKKDGYKPAYSLDFISVKKKPSVISQVLGIILDETPGALQTIKDAIYDEQWQTAQEKAHKLKSSLGLLQAHELLKILDFI